MMTMMKMEIGKMLPPQMEKVMKIMKKPEIK